jgi:hypothetical protein
MATATLNPKLEENTVAELKDMADEMGIDVPSHANKDEIIKAIKKAQANPGPGTTTTEPSETAEVSPLLLAGLTNIIPATDVVADFYGIGKTYNITLADIQGLGANLTGNLQLDNLPAGEVIQYVRIKHSVSVAGTGITACTAQVADSINAAFGTAFDVFQAVSNAATALSTVQLTTGNIGNFAAVTPIYLQLSATGGNLSAATAGAITVWVRYVLLK